MGTALFMVVYMCVIDHGLNLHTCMESHSRLPDNAQSTEDCAQVQQKNKEGKGADTLRIYCNLEKEGPNYMITYDFDNNTIKRQLLPPKK